MMLIGSLYDNWLCMGFNSDSAYLKSQKKLSVLERALTTHDSSGGPVWSCARDHGEQSQNFISNYSGVTGVMIHGGDAAAG